MKLIHCADLHLDSRLNTHLTKEKAAERRRELTGNFCDMVDYATKNDISAILICGDMFDNSHVTAFTKNAVLRSIEENPGISFFILRGNHDSENFLGETENPPKNVFLFNDGWTMYDFNGVKIYGAELLSGNAASLQQNFSPDPSDINIVMLHGQETASNPRDKTEIINLRLFKNKGINYLALGHIHEYKVESLDALGKYCYCGCLEGRGFDEKGEHGFVILDVDVEAKTVTDTFVPFAKRRIFIENVDVTGLNNTFGMASRITEHLKTCSATDSDMVKIVLTGEVDVECEKSIDFLEKNLEKEYYFVKVSDETSLKVNIESFLYDETLKGEFVRTVMNDSSLTPERKAEIVREGLSLFSEVK